MTCYLLPEGVSPTRRSLLKYDVSSDQRMCLMIFSMINDDMW